MTTEINTELVPEIVEQEINGQVEEMINLRDLHEKLGVKRKYADWVKDRIIKCRLKENVHYIVVFPKIRKNPQECQSKGGLSTTDGAIGNTYSSV